MTGAHATGAGVVLAGGRSTRYGDGDKALADLAGTPMVRRVADALAPAIEALVVNCRPEQVDALRPALDGYPRSVRFATDPTPDLGPLGGIRTGLRAVEAHADHAYAAVVACDMPFLDPGFVGHLFDRARGHDAAVPRVDEWFQTTHAVYRAGAMAEACAAALDRDEGKILAALETVDAVVVERAELDRYATPEVFRNCNTPEEVAAAAAAFE
ncbi:MAG: molybdenum cofactor guanylyltransferase [Haloarculaceae archaeon]